MGPILRATVYMYMYETYNVVSLQEQQQNWGIALYMYSMLHMAREWNSLTVL